MFSAKDSANEILDIIKQAIGNDPDFRRVFAEEIVEPTIEEF